MEKYYIWSDIHDEFTFIDTLDLSKFKDSNLIIAGDFAEARRPYYITGIEKVCSIFKKVFLVSGNHEYYGKNIISINKKIKELEQKFSNFVFLNNSTYIDHDQKVCIIGGTLWTDYDNGNPIIKMAALLSMNDYRCIRHGTELEPYRRKLKTDDVLLFNARTIKYIDEMVDKIRQTCDNYKIMIVTHHAPSFGSVHPRYHGDQLNYAYCNNYDNLIINKLKIEYWIHGHVHDSFDYMIGDTNIICNPKGYSTSSSGYENVMFDPYKFVEV